MHNPRKPLSAPARQMMARPDPPFGPITEHVVEFNNNNMKSRKRKRHQQLLEAAYERSTDSDSASELPEHFVEIDPKEIKKDTHRVLGNGAYGVVNLAKWKGRDVAIKLFERTGKSFQRELEHLTKVRHENIIRLYGKYYIEGKEAAGPFMAGLVMEYSKDGSLQYVIFDSDHQYTRADGLSWCRQCAQGVEYLHDMKPKAILHRDLKPANLLLFNEKKVLKLCDFGLARDIKTTMTKFKGTATFIAPEVSQGEKYNEKCDVFSFGVIVWVTLKRGQPKSKKMLGIPTADTSLMGRGTIDNLPQELEKLMESCWSTDPQQRPKMTEIVTILSTPEQYFKDGSLHEVVPKDSSTDASDESSD